ncbi:aminotransferase-like domain-containing protein [Carnobacterium gallinarum]|uniref:aminotransferase-like domain-containing protein n=1 Tax=Carnobacterium gallinarum TaxID=2749 RepID=UPI000551074F|nr:PLP-dependent aminotransferase family protein [Carnobacterium gallinarum]
MPINSYDYYPLSWYPDSTRIKRPKYEAIITLLEEDIVSGVLKANTKLPSQRELADYLDINFTTVTRAYKLGVEKGLLYTNIGSGTFVSSNAFKSITISTDNSPAASIDLGLVSSFEQCNALLVPAIQKVAGQQTITQFLNYQAPTGTAFQKEIAIRWLSTLGVQTIPERLSIVSGVQNGLAIVLSALFSYGDRIVVDFYTYSNFIELAKLFHLTLIPISADLEGMSAIELEKICQLQEVKGIFLMPSCNNPTGSILSASRKKELISIIKAYQLIVIEDDIHAFLTAPFLADYSPPIYQSLPEQTVYLYGMTKFICSGLRVAYLVFPERFKNTLNRSMFNINVKTSSLDSEIITEVLHSGLAQQLLETKKALSQEANALFNTIFDCQEVTGHHPWPYFRCLPIPKHYSREYIETYFNQLGVNVYHSDRFVVKSDYEKAFIRVALSSSSSLEVLETGLLKIKEGLVGLE